MYIDTLIWVIHQHTTCKHDDADKILNIIWQLNMHKLVVPITFGYINKINDHTNRLQLYSLIIRTTNQHLGDP